jgi:hypothetical protein
MHLCLRQEAKGRARATFTVCIAGNAENRSLAQRTFDMWDRSIPQCWFVSRDKSAADKPPQNSSMLLFVVGSDQSTWAAGLAAASSCVAAAFTCEYVFTHDDDLQFSINPHVQHTAVDNIHGLRMSDVLIDLLAKYRPAVASFPWAVEDERYPSLKENAEVHDTQVFIAGPGCTQRMQAPSAAHHNHCQLDMNEIVLPIPTVSPNSQLYSSRTPIPRKLRR